MEAENVHGLKLDKTDWGYEGIEPLLFNKDIPLDIALNSSLASKTPPQSTLYQLQTSGVLEHIWRASDF